MSKKWFSIDMLLTTDELTVVRKLEQHVQAVMPPDPTGHDWPHVCRVLKNARYICSGEGGNLYQVTLMALTHDLYDHKFFAGTQQQAEKELENLLCGMGVSKKDAQVTVENVFALSFSKSSSGRALSHEGKMVQDADRLEAIGAIGIARAFAYGGFKNRLMNHHRESATGNQKKEGTTFDHFFEKLLRLYDLLNTDTAREMARERFDFMKAFVHRFREEWG